MVSQKPETIGPADVRRALGKTEEEMNQHLQEVRDHLRKYADSSDLLAARTVGITVGALCLALYILATCTSRFAWIMGTIFLGMVNARMIVVFHDANHGSLFKTKLLNRIVGQATGAWVSISYDGWTQEHVQQHHPYLNRSDHIFVNDGTATIYWTTEDWKRFPMWRKVLLRIVRDPITFMIFLPTVVWMCGLNNPGKIPGLHLVVPDLPRHRILKTPVIDYILPNLVPLLDAYIGYRFLGTRYVVACFLARALSYSIGFAVFHLNHAPVTTQMFYFNVPKHLHTLDLTGLYGATVFKVPFLLQWMTLGIEYHVIHHVNKNVPCYRLADAYHEAPPRLWDGTIYLNYKAVAQSMLATMWDEKHGRFVSFDWYNWLLP